MNATDDELRESVKSCERAALCGGIAVVAGLVIEVVLAFHHAPFDSFEGTWGAVIADSLVALGVASEILFSRLGFSRQYELQRRSDEIVAEAKTIAAQANERAAELARETATLQWQLEQQRQKLAQRLLSPEQKAAMISALRGKLSEVMLVIQNDPEANAFAMQLMTVLAEAGVKMYGHEPPREDRWFAPAGLMMYSPVGTNEDQLQNEPLYRALKAANLFGGTMGQPFTSGQPTLIHSPDEPPTFALITGYADDILYVGQKSPF